MVYDLSKNVDFVIERPLQSSLPDKIGRKLGELGENRPRSRALKNREIRSNDFFHTCFLGPSWIVLKSYQEGFSRKNLFAQRQSRFQNWEKIGRKIVRSEIVRSGEERAPEWLHHDDTLRLYNPTVEYKPTGAPCDHFWPLYRRLFGKLGENWEKNGRIFVSDEFLESTRCDH